MSFVKSIIQIERKFAWSFLGVVLAILFFLASAYLSLIYEKKPIVQFDIISEANVLEVREQLGKLSIFFDGDNISQKGLNLRIVTLKISNIGQVDILQSYFDWSEPWGFLVNDARIIEVNPLESNSDYLRSKLSPVIHQPDSVLLDKVILERDKYITLKVLLVHSVGKTPSIVPFGKIAGVDGIDLSRSYLEPSEPNIWTRVFGGTLFVQLARLFSYTVGLILISLAIGYGIVSPISSANNRRRKRKRKILIDRYKSSYVSSPTQADLAVLEVFECNGATPIRWLTRSLSDDAELRYHLARYEIALKTKTSEFEQDIIESELAPLDLPQTFLIGRYQLIKKLIKAGFITIEDSKVSVTEQLKSSVETFLKFLDASGYTD